MILLFEKQGRRFGATFLIDGSCCQGRFLCNQELNYESQSLTSEEMGESGGKRGSEIRAVLDYSQSYYLLLSILSDSAEDRGEGLLCCFTLALLTAVNSRLDMVLMGARRILQGGP